MSFHLTSFKHTVQMHASCHNEQHAALLQQTCITRCSSAYALCSSVIPLAIAAFSRSLHQRSQWWLVHPCLYCLLHYLVVLNACCICFSWEVIEHLQMCNSVTVCEVIILHRALCANPPSFLCQGAMHTLDCADSQRIVLRGRCRPSNTEICRALHLEELQGYRHLMQSGSDCLSGDHFLQIKPWS